MEEVGGFLVRRLCRVKMKKIFLVLFLVLLIGVVVAAPASEINMVKGDSIVNGNGICESYENEFSAGESDVVSINGVSYTLELVESHRVADDDNYDSGVRWKVNGEEFDDLWNAMSEKNGGGLHPSNHWNDWENSIVLLSFDEKFGYRADCLGYSQSTGLVTEIEVSDGWNLVPYNSYAGDCSDGMLCADDILVEYFYVPKMNEYFSKEDVEKIGEELQEKYGNNNEEAMYGDEKYKDLVEYLVDELNPGIRMASKWIYVKKGTGTKKIIDSFGAYIPYREDYLKPRGDNYRNLFEGWNFLMVDAFMLYDDEWNYEPLSMGDMKGSCNFNGMYMWDANDQEWDSSGESSRFDSSDIGKGFLVKVSGDCVLGYDSSGLSVPGLPGSSEEVLSIPDFPESIGDYNLVGGVPSNLDYDCNTIEAGSVDVSVDFSAYYGTELCAGGLRLEYVNGDDEGLFVNLMDVTSGKGFYEAYINSLSTVASVGSQKVRRMEKHELTWWTRGDFDLIMTQEYTRTSNGNGDRGYSYNYGAATGDDAVTAWFLDNYPPVSG